MKLLKNGPTTYPTIPPSPASLPNSSPLFLQPLKLSPLILCTHLFLGNYNESSRQGSGRPLSILTSRGRAASPTRSAPSPPRVSFDTDQTTVCTPTTRSYSNTYRGAASSSTTNLLSLATASFLVGRSATTTTRYRCRRCQPQPPTLFVPARPTANSPRWHYTLLAQTLGSLAPRTARSPSPRSTRSMPSPARRPTRSPPKWPVPGFTHSKRWALGAFVPYNGSSARLGSPSTLSLNVRATSTLCRCTRSASSSSACRPCTRLCSHSS
mmetsp:Transcript_16496/g.51605  ORF Transcript_16496/g.51605 Transcript_16496/m.51605 type:complete len:268 (+) Transcript_16496:139-942(+)